MATFFRLTYIHIGMLESIYRTGVGLPFLPSFTTFKTEIPGMRSDIFQVTLLLEFHDNQ